MVDQLQTNGGMCVTKDGVVPSGTDALCCCGGEPLCDFLRLGDMNDWEAEITFESITDNNCTNCEFLTSNTFIGTFKGSSGAPPTQVFVSYGVTVLFSSDVCPFTGYVIIADITCTGGNVLLRAAITLNDGLRRTSSYEDTITEAEFLDGTTFEIPYLSGGGTACNQSAASAFVRFYAP